MHRKPWHAVEADVAPVLEASGYRCRGFWIPSATLSSPEGHPWPSGEWSQRRLALLLEEYAALCEMAETVFPILTGYLIRGHELHTKCWAIDVLPVDGWTIAQMGSLARERWAMPGSRLWGVGMCPEWLHLDVRPRRCHSDWTHTNPESAF